MKKILSLTGAFLLIAGCGSRVSNKGLGGSRWQGTCQNAGKYAVGGVQSQRIGIAFSEDHVTAEITQFAKVGCAEPLDSARYTYRYTIGEDLGQVRIGTKESLAEQKVDVKAVDLSLVSITIERSKPSRSITGRPEVDTSCEGIEIPQGKAVNLLAALKLAPGQIPTCSYFRHDGLASILGRTQENFYGFSENDSSKPGFAKAGAKTYSALGIFEVPNHPSQLVFSDVITDRAERSKFVYLKPTLVEVVKK